MQSEGVFRVMQDNGGCVALVHGGLVYLVQYILYMYNYLSNLIYNIPSFFNLLVTRNLYLSSVLNDVKS